MIRNSIKNKFNFKHFQTISDYLRPIVFIGYEIIYILSNFNSHFLIFNHIYLRLCLFIIFNKFVTKLIILMWYFQLFFI